jgi:hypothetical protein
LQAHEQHRPRAARGTHGAEVLCVRVCQFTKLLSLFRLNLVSTDLRGTRERTNRKVAGSSPDQVIQFFYLHNRRVFSASKESYLWRGGKGCPARKAHNLTAMSQSIRFFYLYLLAIRIKYILLANLQAKTVTLCAYYVMMRSSPVRGPLEPSIRSTGQDFLYPSSVLLL